MAQIRKQLNELFFGTNGTGKTTNMIKLAVEYAIANPKKNVLFLMPDDSEKKYDEVPMITKNDLLSDFGIAKMICSTPENKKEKSIYTEIYERHNKADVKFNGLIVNDDMGALLQRRPNDVITLLSRRRQLNLDMFWNFHGLTTDAPKSFWRYVTGVTLHKTTDDYHDTLDKVGSKGNEFLDVYKEVQEASAENPYFSKRLSLI